MDHRVICLAFAGSVGILLVVFAHVSPDYEYVISASALLGFNNMSVLISYANADITVVHQQGPLFPPTKGEVWPQPQYEYKLSYFYDFSPKQYEIKITNKKCQILISAIERYMKTLLNLHYITKRFRRRISVRRERQGAKQYGQYRGSIKQLLINLTTPCQDYPHYKMDQKYKLDISASSLLTSNSIWGILAGLETTAQLFYLTDEYDEIRINKTSIVDFPSYPHRGLLLDTARHYISVDIILKTLDAMAMNKMNVFHWHIVDDESFPYQSSELPELSKQGAFHPDMIYTMSQIKLIIQYARDRGIRVLPEIDVPGHTRCWGLSHPDVLTKCYDDKKIVGWGPLHPLKPSTYELIRKLYTEVQNLFHDKHFHIGGDEVNLVCWLTNPSIQNYMNFNNISSVSEVFAFFIKRVLKLLDPSSTPIVWQEVFENLGEHLPKKAIVQIWKIQWISELVEALNQNRSVILSAPWYLDHMTETFTSLYSLPPRRWVKDMVSRDKLHLIVGAEASMWGEKVDDTNVLTRTWPRASALAELVWNDSQPSLTQFTLRRAEEHVCRMRRRGVPAEPAAGPGFCVL